MFVPHVIHLQMRQHMTLPSIIPKRATSLGDSVPQLFAPNDSTSQSPQHHHRTTFHGTTVFLYWLKGISESFRIFHLNYIN